MSDRDVVAKMLAETRYRVEPAVTQVRRILSAPDVESRPDEPIKLLEANAETIASGIMPLYFRPDPASGIVFPTTIVEVTPSEFESIEQGLLPLPNGWRLGAVLPPPRDTVQPSA